MAGTTFKDFCEKRGKTTYADLTITVATGITASQVLTKNASTGKYTLTLTLAAGGNLSDNIKSVNLTDETSMTGTDVAELVALAKADTTAFALTITGLSGAIEAFNAGKASVNLVGIESGARPVTIAKGVDGAIYGNEKTMGDLVISAGPDTGKSIVYLDTKLSRGLTLPTVDQDKFAIAINDEFSNYKDWFSGTTAVGSFTTGWTDELFITYDKNGVERKVSVDFDDDGSTYASDIAFYSAYENGTLDASAATAGVDINLGDAAKYQNFTYGIGGAGNDVLKADSGTGADTAAATLDGGTGDDLLFSPISGGSLIGGDGKDTFIFGSMMAGKTTNIADYDVSEGDIIQVKGYALADLIFDTLAGANNQLVITLDGAAALADETIIVESLSNDMTTGSNTLKMADSVGHITNYVVGQNLDYMTGNNVHYVGIGSSISLTSKLTDNVDIDLSDTLYAGIEVVTSGVGHDTLTGNLDKATTLNGGAGDDLLIGQQFSDSLNGGEGDDTMNSAMGNDTLTGGEGRDTFVLNNDAGREVVITDYDGLQDKIKLVNSAFAGVTFDSVVGNPDALVMNLSDVARGASTSITLDNLPNEVMNGSNMIKIEDNLGKTTQVIVGTNFNYTKEDVIYRGIGDLPTTLTSTLPSAVNINLNEDKYVAANILTVVSGKGNDTLTAHVTLGSRLVAGAGNDVLVSGAGNDELTGGEGKDTFVFSEDFGMDTITDYAAGDKIKMKDAMFSDLDIDFDSYNNLMIFTKDGGINLANANKAESTVIKIEDMLGQRTNVAIGENLNYAKSEENYVYKGLGHGTLNVTGSTSTDLWLDTAVNSGNIVGVNVIDASASSGKHELHGDSNANVLIGGKGADQIWGGITDASLGATTVRGNEGADVFYVGSNDGSTYIADYSTAQQDVIKFYKDKISSVAIGAGDNSTDAKLSFGIGQDVIVAGAISGKRVLTIEDPTGEKRERILVGTDELAYAGNITRYVATQENGKLVVGKSGKGTNLWLGEDDVRIGADIDGITTIDASATDIGNDLHGDSNDNVLIGGSGDD